jgi:DNA-binding response OmpR family regulator
VVLSADAAQNQIDHLLDAGAVAYLTKPIDVRRLLEIVDAILGPIGDQVPTSDGQSSSGESQSATAH